MACTSYGCDDEFGAHTQIDCQEYLKGGISAYVLLLCDHTVTSPSNATEINDNITAGTAILVSGIKMSVTDPSPVKITPPVGCSTDIVVTYDRTLTIVDGNISQANNTNIIDPLVAGAPFDSIIAYECDANQVTWFRPGGDGFMRGEGGRVIPDNNDDVQVYNITINYRSLVEAEIAAAPTGIFT